MVVQTFQGAVRIIPLGSVKKDVGSSLIGGGRIQENDKDLKRQVWRSGERMQPKHGEGLTLSTLVPFAVTLSCLF